MIELLAALWQSTADRLERRCHGVTDEEFFWEPTPDAWNVRLGPSGWTYEYEFAPPKPAPVTTIGWRLMHLAADNWIYSEHAFGPGIRNFPDLSVPATADATLDHWRRSREPIMSWLAGATEEQLAELRPSHLGGRRTAGAVIAILLDEQIHHGAEIALLRDLSLRMG
jgi:DinB superfamily